MGDDSDNLHDCDAKLCVGSLEIASFTDQIPGELLSVFTDAMYRSRPATEAAHPPQVRPGELVHEFVSTGPVITDRLDLFGYSPARVMSAIEHALDEARHIADLAHGILGEGPEPVLTADQWIAELRLRSRRGTPDGSRGRENTGWLMSLIEDVDRRIALRAALLACPGDEVRLDVTHLWAMGALESIGDLCSNGLAATRAAASDNAPIVVLAEGRTDIEFLESALRLLYPHLVDLIRFMDFGQRPQGSAGTLVNTVKAFAAAGVANRVVALFDNDTAAADAVRSLPRATLPPNICVCQYPPVDLGVDYPTLGPPPAHTRVANADVNGLAGSIELYLGRDSLTGPGGDLRPVHWSSYNSGMRQYQGEITDKDAVHHAYRAKIRAASADPSLIARQDWSGIRAILDLVIRAFS